MVLYSKVAVVVGGTTIENITSYSWSEVSSSGDNEMVPILTMASLNPVGWRSSHKWVQGQFTTTGTINPSVYAYIKQTTPNSITPLYAICTDTTKTNTYKESFSTAYIQNGEETHNIDADSPQITWKFVANYCTITAT